MARSRKVQRGSPALREAIREPSLTSDDDVSTLHNPGTGPIFTPHVTHMRCLLLRSRMALRCAAGVMAPALAASGCYTLTTLRTGSPTPGASVRVTIWREAAAGLTDQLGAGVNALDGRVLSSTADSLVLGVNQVLRQNESVDPWRGERVALARSWLTQIQGRNLSVVRTTLLAGGALAAVIIIANSLSLDLSNPNH